MTIPAHGGTSTPQTITFKSRGLMKVVRDFDYLGVTLDSRMSLSAQLKKTERDDKNVPTSAREAESQN